MLRMPGSRFWPEQIIGELREAEVLLSQGKTAVAVSGWLNINEQTHARWRKEYGGMGTDQAHRPEERRRT